jgi:hypothetical protein
MFPFCFEWTWDAGRIIFMGLLYLVLGAMSLGIFYTAPHIISPYHDASSCHPFLGNLDYSEGPYSPCAW